MAEGESGLELDPRITEMWQPPDRLSVSDFADRHRKLVDRYSAEPGPYHTNRTPWMREIQDAFSSEDVSVIVLVKCARVGGSEGMINMLFHSVCNDPSPSLYVLPTKDEAKDEAKGRIADTVLACPTWSRRVKHGGWLTAEKLEFDRCDVYMGALAAPSSLTRKTVRNLFVDELDNGLIQATRMGASMDLAMERVTTYGDRAKQVYASTPVMDDGPIFSMYNTTDRREWHVPCPHCGFYQTLQFENLKMKPKYAKLRDAGQIEAIDCADYICKDCGAAISESHKAWMNNRGLWVPQWVESIQRLPIKTQKIVDKAAHMKREERWTPKFQGTEVPTRRRGYWLQGLISPWRPWRRIMAKYFETRTDRERFQVFINSWLGRGWHEVVQSVRGKLLRLKAEEGVVPNVVPKHGQVLIMTVDVQADHFWYVVRAWGAFERSWLIRYGRSDSFDELIAITRQPLTWLGDRSKQLYIQAMGIDTRYRRSEVHAFARSNPGVYPMQGTNSQTFRWRPTKVEYKPGGGLRDDTLQVYSIATDTYKDKLHRHASLPLGDRWGQWHLCREITDEYFHQVTAEKKIRTKVAGKIVEKWQTVTAGRANHLLDCEVNQMALADILGLYYLPPLPDESLMEKIDRPVEGLQDGKDGQTNRHATLTTA